MIGEDINTIESKVAREILQRRTEITIGDITYNIPKPTMATLIMVSEEISKLPNFDLNENNIIESSLAAAKNCEPFGDILAILILGAKKIREREEAGEDVIKELKEKLLLELSPTEMRVNILQILNTAGIYDFFALSTFLNEINLLRPTKGKVDTETTVFGQLS